MTIDDAIIDAARAGRIRLSVYPISSGYQASFSADGSSWRCEMAADPLTALNKVLGLVPGVAGPLRDAPEEMGLFE